ncbi:NAD(P)-binding protein [Xylariaceae sp. FL0016]|nr:NAD(P)-binding protein [Xylariaceae sp. FL0016]
MTAKTPSPHRILVLGAGELGTAVLEGLVHHAKYSPSFVHISVLLRTSSIQSVDVNKAAQNARLKSLGAELVAGDVTGDSVRELAMTFAKYDTVIGCVGMGLPLGSQTKISGAVLEAGVARYVPWQFGIDYDVVGQGSAQDLFDEQLKVRGLLRAQEKTGWNIVSTGLFMSFLFLSAFGVVDREARKIRALGSWGNRVTVTTPEDIGRCTVEAVLDPRGLGSGIVYVSGDTVSYGDVARLVEERFEGDWDKEEWDMVLLRRGLEEQPDDGMLKYRNVFGAGVGVAWDKEKTLNYERGIKMTTVKEYLAQMD